MGAELVVLPENFAFLGEHETAKMAMAEAVPGEGRILATMRADRRASTRIDLVLGGMPEAVSATHVHNTSVYLDARGEIRGIYRKIHLFDVAIPDGAVYRESASVAPGDEAGRRRRHVRQGRALDLLRPALPRALPRARRPRARAS